MSISDFPEAGDFGTDTSSFEVSDQPSYSEGLNAPEMTVNYDDAHTYGGAPANEGNSSFTAGDTTAYGGAAGGDNPFLDSTRPPAGGSGAGPASDPPLLTDLAKPSTPLISVREDSGDDVSIPYPARVPQPVAPGGTTPLVSVDESDPVGDIKVPQPPAPTRPEPADPAPKQPPAHLTPGTPEWDAHTRQQAEKSREMSGGPSSVGKPGPVDSEAEHEKKKPPKQTPAPFGPLSQKHWDGTELPWRGR